MENKEKLLKVKRVNEEFVSEVTKINALLKFIGLGRIDTPITTLKNNYEAYVTLCKGHGLEPRLSFKDFTIFNHYKNREVV